MAKEIIIHMEVGGREVTYHYMFDGREDFSDAIRRCLFPRVWSEILSGKYRIREIKGQWLRCDADGTFNVRSDIFNRNRISFEVALIEE